MTKADFIDVMDDNNPLNRIANDTVRTPNERDLARVMVIATLLLEKGDLISARHILQITLNELKS